MIDNKRVLASAIAIYKELITQDGDSHDLPSDALGRRDTAAAINLLRRFGLIEQAPGTESGLFEPCTVGRRVDFW